MKKSLSPNTSAASQTSNVVKFSKLQNCISNAFNLIVLTHEFAPRVKYGEQVTMLRGFPAEIGDIVAVGMDSADCPRLAFYSEGLDYYAVEVAITRKARSIVEIDEPIPA